MICSTSLASRPTEAGEDEPPDLSGEPSILVTSLMGAKGLQAEHVFVLGLNGGHFPTDNQAPREDEVCELLVVLTRARERCTLVSVGNFGGQWLEDSIFLERLDPLLEQLKVDKQYFEANIQLERSPLKVGARVTRSSDCLAPLSDHAID